MAVAPAYEGEAIETEAVDVWTDGSGLATAGRRSACPPVDGATLEAARMFLDQVEATYRPITVLIYGSRARGDHRPDSDADLAVILAGQRSDRSVVTRAFSGIAFDILMKTGVRIHALCLWEAELRRPSSFSNPALIANIVREGARL